MKKPFRVGTTPAFVQVLDGNEVPVLHILRADTTSDKQMLQRARLVTMALNRLGQLHFEDPEL